MSGTEEELLAIRRLLRGVIEQIEQLAAIADYRDGRQAELIHVILTRLREAKPMTNADCELCCKREAIRQLPNGLWVCRACLRNESSYYEPLMKCHQRVNRLEAEVQHWRALIPEVIEQLEATRGVVQLASIDLVIAKLREASQ